MKKCEYCGKNGNVDVTMPTAVGIFNGTLCLKHSLEINSNTNILFNIIGKRAKIMKIKLPTDIKTMGKIVNKK